MDSASGRPNWIEPGQDLCSCDRSAGGSSRHRTDRPAFDEFRLRADFPAAVLAGGHRIGEKEYLFIEAGGFSTKNKTGWISPWLVFIENQPI
jgi:hypothetical protein